MAVADLIVEDGTGLDNADAYIDVQFFRDYFGNLNDADVTDTVPVDDVCKAAIRKATQFFDAQWGPRAKGDLLVPGDDDTDPQALIFPRDDDAGIRLKLKQAIAELAKLALSAPLAGAGAVVASPSAAQISSMKAGSVEIAFAQAIKPEIETAVAERFYLIERLCAPFLRSGALNTGSRR